MTSTTTITIIKSHNHYQIANAEQHIPQKTQTDQTLQESRYDFRPQKTFLLVSDKSGHTEVVDYYIIRDGNTQKTESRNAFPG